jgi:hypothetical protein
MHSSRSIPTPRQSGAGSWSSHRNTGGRIGEPAGKAVTTSIRQSSREPSGRPSWWLAWPGARRATRSGTRSPRRRIRHPDRSGVAGAQGRETTMIYTHVLNRGPSAVQSPIDRFSL